MISFVECRAIVPFPAITGERVYMREVSLSRLPTDLAHWQPTVDAMAKGVTADKAYLMIDQGFVRAGQMLRRPGVHVDGYWIPGVARHGHRAPLSGHGSPSGGHGSPAPTGGHGNPGSRHGNPSPPRDVHSPMPSRHGHSRNGKEAIILASDVTGCVGYSGNYDPAYGEGGDASRIDLRHLDRVELSAGRAWVGNVAFLHESIPMASNCHRTVVRLNVPGWSP